MVPIWGSVFSLPLHPGQHLLCCFELLTQFIRSIRNLGRLELVSTGQGLGDLTPQACFPIHMTPDKPPHI